MTKTKVKKLDRQACIIYCIVKRLTEFESLEYLESQGHKISSTTLYEEKKKLKKNQIDFSNEIAGGQFFRQHIRAIKDLEMMREEFYKNYNKEKDPLKKTVILTRMQKLIPFITAAYDYTRKIMEIQERLDKIHKGPIPQWEKSFDEKYSGKI